MKAKSAGSWLRLGFVPSPWKKALHFPFCFHPKFLQKNLSVHKCALKTTWNVELKDILFLLNLKSIDIPWKCIMTKLCKGVNQFVLNPDKLLFSHTHIYRRGRRERGVPRAWNSTVASHVNGLMPTPGAVTQYLPCAALAEHQHYEPGMKLRHCPFFTCWSRWTVFSCLQLFNTGMVNHSPSLSPQCITAVGFLSSFIDFPICVFLLFH